MKIEEIIAKAAVIPVLEVADIETAAPLADALKAGGLSVIELTLRTPCAFEALAAMKETEPSLIVGMGTIRTPDDIDQAVEHEADFLVTPGVSERLLAALREAGTPALPGIATPGEAMMAAEAGFLAQKFFPAEPAGGVPYLRSLIGPLPDLKFCPTGNITPDKAPAYLELPNVLCVGGSWIATKEMIAKGDWEVITRNAARAASLKSRSA